MLWNPVFIRAKSRMTRIKKRINNYKKYTRGDQSDSVLKQLRWRWKPRHVNLSSAIDGKHSRSQMSLKITHLRGKKIQKPGWRNTLNMLNVTWLVLLTDQRGHAETITEVLSKGPTLPTRKFPWRKIIFLKKEIWC